MRLATMVVAVAMTLAVSARADDRNVWLVASGEVSGSYYPEAGALCRVVNKERPRGRGCAVVPTSGSAANLAALRSGEADFAIVQSRAAGLAFTGADAFKEAGAFPELRVLMALHGEATAMLIRPGAGIEQVSDLKGKRVSLGRKGTFQRTMAEVVLDVGGMAESDLAGTVDLDLADQGGALCEGAIDAAFFTGVHPLPEVVEAMEECGAILVPLRAKALDANLRRLPWLSRLAIKGNTYEGVKDDVAALGPRALLVATTHISADEAYGVLKAVHANFGAFVRLHPVLAGLAKPATARETAPLRLHDGAERFYADTGLLK
ncbi:MAG: TAXI family TRAP transporter solute-binding subunit [Magnetospirillum sp.]|nr:TAXI family TRAP transporter solute-binding subunit [Magnetospirillum sp.]